MHRAYTASIDASTSAGAEPAEAAPVEASGDASSSSESQSPTASPAAGQCTAAGGGAGTELASGETLCAMML